MPKITELLESVEAAVEALNDKRATLDAARAKRDDTAAEADAAYEAALEKATTAYETAKQYAEEDKDNTLHAVVTAYENAATDVEQAEAYLTTLKQELDSRLGGVLQPQNPRVRVA